MAVPASLSMYQQFKNLHEEELFDSLVDLGDLFLTSDSRPRNLTAQRDLLKGAREEFRCVVLYGYALFQEHRYRQAIDVYGRACSMLLHTYPPPGSVGRIGGRSVNGPKVESPSGTLGFERLFTEDDIKYRLAQAWWLLGDVGEATCVLETIPPVNRSAKTLILMIKLNSTRTAYVLDKLKQVLRQVPLALRVLQSWFQNGGKLVELNANLGKNVQEEKVSQLLNRLVQSHSFYFTGSIQSAYQNATVLQEDPVLSHNPTIMMLQARCQTALGNLDHAARIYSSIDHGNPNFFQDMDDYAALLFEQGEKNQPAQQSLQKLSDRLLKTASLSPEAWVAKGYSALSRKDMGSALKYAEHANSLDDNRFRTHVFLGLVYLKKDELAPAQRCFRKALEIVPTCLEAHRYLIETYQRKVGEKETIVAAQNMYRACKKNPRCVQYYADCLLQYSSRIRELTGILEKHMKAYPSDQKSGILLAQAYEKMKQPEKAIEVLKKQLCRGNLKEIHESLSRLYRLTDNAEKEAEHSSLAAAVPLPNMADPRADSPLPGPSGSSFRGSPGSTRDSANEEINDSDNEEDEDDNEGMESGLE